MGLFANGTENSVVLEQNLQEPNALMESYIYDEVSQLSEASRQEFLESDVAATLLEAGFITKKTMMKLSKNDDLTRRLKIAAFEVARQHNDVLWTQLVRYRSKEKQLIHKIMLKYGSRANKMAKLGQRDFLKNKLTSVFMRK